MVDESIEGKNDGKILGVNAEMEYKASNANQYIPCTSDSLDNLSAGGYMIRYKETSVYKPSEPIEVVVKAGKKSSDSGVTPEVPKDNPLLDKSVLKKVSVLSISAKKSGKKIKVKTLKDAKVTITCSKKIMLNGKKRVKKITYSNKKNKSGVFTIKVSSKLKKKMVIKVTVEKTGYTKRTKSKKIS